ncbi:hypothetical protein M9Y10_044425 [Tritrichomonas musculus]|uniref:Uncharacterized protein n=1 Tax=Tritrichomonas musculus TaxID=1915356 RepID=A0ABR2JSB0_9EUKA
MSSSYQHRLFGCFSDLSVCTYGLFLPFCLTADTWARIRHERCTICHCLCLNHPFWIRQFIKNRYGMETNYVGDCIIYTFCYPCANCQDAREVRTRDLI